jgi:hypothetical protein
MVARYMEGLRAEDRVGLSDAELHAAAERFADQFTEEALAMAPARGISKDPPARPYYDVAPERTL